MTLHPLAHPRLDRIDRSIAAAMRQYGFLVLRISMAIIFIWFGVLKFFPGLSPAVDLVERTVYWLPPNIFIPILAAWEVLIGLCLLIRPLIRLAILLLFLQMGGTFLPLVILPEITWLRFPYAPTLEGQYILKNLIIIGAALVIGSTVRQLDAAATADSPAPQHPGDYASEAPARAQNPDRM